MDRLPEWLTSRSVSVPVSPRAAGIRVGIARRGLGALIAAAATLFDSEKSTSRATWLLRLDARSKILGLLALIVAATIVQSLMSLAICVLGAWILAGAGGLGLRRFAFALLAVPMITLAIAAPAALSPVTAGRPVVVLCHMGAGHWGPWTWPEVLAVTDRGLYVAGRFVLRSLACVSFGAVLAASSRPRELFGGLRALGVPATFVMVLDMAVRYLALLLRSAEEIHLAKLSRSIGKVSVGSDQAWAAAGIGELYRKSRMLAAEVGDAMLSRGFSGEVLTLRRGSWGWPESAFLLSCAIWTGAALGLG